MRNAHSRSIVPWYCAVKISNLNLSSQISAPLAQDKVAETGVGSAESEGWIRTNDLRVMSLRVSTAGVCGLGC